MPFELKQGSVIKSPHWPEPIKILEIEDLGDFIRINGVMIKSKKYIDDIIQKKDLDKFKTYDAEKLNFSENADEVFLGLEGYRFRLAYLFDPFLATTVSKIDPLPHQIDAVYNYILKLPRIRFLIADDPGAGKTIMAGLVIKELKLRGLAKRILIVVPGHLKDQWRRELKEKFSENFVVVDRNVINSHYGENVWEKYNQIITSMDFAKQDDVLASLGSVHWDLVIVDEAHKMSAYKYGDKTRKTGRYRLGEVLSKNTEHLIFLTATPHRGDAENFRLFLDLLYPGFFSSVEMIEESIKNKDNPLFIRRLKEDLVDFNGKPLFLPRHVKTIKFSCSDEEMRLYNALSKYVIEQYNKALKSDKKRNIAFALLILQRRFASSVYALKCSLERRKKRLEKIKDLANNKLSFNDIEDIDDYEEIERWKIEEIWEALTVSETLDELKKEINYINKLIKMADEIIASESETKLKELKELLEKYPKDQKILIFTESRDTLEYLVEKIRLWGHSVTFIHGGMKLEDRIRAEQEFRNNAQIMVATEAAGEGINLQFCNIMINYDIPWNPNRLEQRMGRIHRYGQTKEVFIYNLVADNTREGKVLARLLDKLEEIRRHLGDKVFDVIGEIFYGKKLYQLVLEAAANARDIDEILKEIEIDVDEEYLRRVREALGDSLAIREIDYTRIRDISEKCKEYRLAPEYTEAFFIKAFKKAGGKIAKVKDYYRIDSIPYEIRKIAEDERFKNMYGSLARRYAKITFDKEVAMKNSDVEFVSFGHPLFEAVLEWVLRNYLDKCKVGAVFKDVSGVYDGIIWFFEGEVKDGTGEIAGKRLFAIYDDGYDFKEINPAIIWDLVPATDVRGIEIENIDERKEKAKRFAIMSLMEYKNDILKERERQADIKRRYGIKSLENLISELDSKLLEYYEKKESEGKKMDLPIVMAERRKKEYEEALERLKEEIERQKNLTVSMPEFVGAIRVISERKMVSDKEVERIGMEIAMAYERLEGRNPIDVSSKNLGYDIYSEGNGEVRYIEVKARATTGEIALTPNEWFMAKRFKDKYWLYIVENAVMNPTLYIINNPAENLNAIEKVEVVRFIVPTNEWKFKGIPKKIKLDKKE